MAERYYWAEVSDMSRQDDTLPSTEYLLKQAIFEAMKDVHTMLPGVIDSFDSDLQRAKITLANAMELEDETVVKMPPLINVPIQFPRWGNYVITMPVAKGDECAVFFSERSLERFLEIGDTGKPPNSTRFHDLSDGFAVMGLSSKENKVDSFSGSDLEIRSLDGTKKIVLTSGGNVETHGGDFAIKDGGLDVEGGDADISSGVLKIAGTKVVDVQQPLIAPPAGGTVIDVQSRAVIGTILTTLQAHGLTL